MSPRAALGMPMAVEYLRSLRIHLAFMSDAHCCGDSYQFGDGPIFLYCIVNPPVMYINDYLALQWRVHFLFFFPVKNVFSFLLVPSAFFLIFLPVPRSLAFLLVIFVLTCRMCIHPSIFSFSLSPSPQHLGVCLFSFVLAR